MMKYILFAIFLVLAILLIWWKIKSRSNSQDSSDSSETKKKGPLSELWAKILDLDWETMIESFSMFMVCVVIIFGAPCMIYKLSTDARVDARMNQVERQLKAEFQARTRSQVQTQVQPSHSSPPPRPRVAETPLHTPPQVKVEKVDDNIWEIVLPADQIARTGIFVREGQKIKISAEGEVKWNSALPPCGPEGWRSTPREGMTYPESYFSLDTRAGSLLVKIGEKIFRVGRERTITAPASGKLFFLVNDQWEHLSSNTGSFEIRVEVLRSRVRSTRSARR